MLVRPATWVVSNYNAQLLTFKFLILNNQWSFAPISFTPFSAVGKFPIPIHQLFPGLITPFRMLQHIFFIKQHFFETSLYVHL